ncbi:type II toxin-antitoxin system HicB family antitoxin [Bacteroidetes/Chlorobi group bacterium ChocPot_Mid]|jgi:predicted RNase H-like HicB family nuclease|nr:MAG: type II toxin-antitoxin system HicB family antitoxin [Bacteroidetes/Chlorobi group bacterium ChocPot_Mid]
MTNIVIDIKIEPLEEGGFLALSDDLPGLLAEGRTYYEAQEIAQDVARKLIESYIEHNDPLPEKIKSQIDRKSKKMKLRIPVAVSL